LSIAEQRAVGFILAWSLAFLQVRQEKEEEMFKRGELLGKFTAKKLFEWSDKRYDQKY